MWFERWFLSSNAKDIGVLYLIYALFAGLIGTAFSVLIRLELSGPGVQYIADNQLYNSIITAHAIIMIFFMVNKYFILKLQPITFFNKVNSDNNSSPLSESNNNNDGNNVENNEGNQPENGSNRKHNYVKVLVDDPFNNRDIILKVTKKQKGILYVFLVADLIFLSDGLIKFANSMFDEYTVLSAIALISYADALSERKVILKNNNNKSGVYRWINLVNGKSYVGSSVNLGYRLKQYYSVSYLNRKKSASSISRALVKYGHSNFKLEILEYCEADRLIILEREQYYIDLLKPEYNILKIAGSPLGYKHTEESLAKMRNRKLSKEHLYIVLTRILSDDHKAAVKKARTNSIHSADARAKMRNFIHSEETKAKLSQRLTNYNLSKGHKIEITNIVENTKTVYESIRKAAISLNTNHSTIRNYIKSGKLYKGLYKINCII